VSLDTIGKDCECVLNEVLDVLNEALPVKSNFGTKVSLQGRV
jgi:hypothetical protein